MKELMKLYNEYARHEFNPPSSGAGDIATFARHFNKALRKDCEESGFDVLSVDYDGDMEISAFLRNCTTGLLAHIKIFSMSGYASYPLERVRYEQVENVDDVGSGEWHVCWLTRVIDNVKRLTD